MIERDMEDLIAAFPDDFFQGKQFVLVARQKSLAGVGRFDLLFEDRFGSTIVMELKARPLKYEDATQVAGYRDELKEKGCKNVVMWLVAPQIPRSVREFLDDKGIEYTEIHFTDFRRTAERHGFVVESEVESRIDRAAVIPPWRVSRVVHRIRGRSLLKPGIEHARLRLGNEWTVRELAEVLGIHRSNAVRRLKRWLVERLAKRVRPGRRGRAGSLAKYRFMETLPEDPSARRGALEECSRRIKKFADETKRQNLRDRFYRRLHLATQISPHEEEIDQVLEFMRKEGLARPFAASSDLWEIFPFTSQDKWP
ncbi:MAG: endonuclease NucS domain-containing protein [Candidatus Acidiferrum sp.]